MWPFRKIKRAPPTDLRDYVCRHCGLSPDKYSQCDDLLNALRADGDDAFDFFESLALYFAVDMSAYDWRKFQHSEGELLTPGIVNRISYNVRRWFGGARDEPDPRRQLLPISSKHLEDVVARGSWFDPIEHAGQQVRRS